MVLLDEKEFDRLKEIEELVKECKEYLDRSQMESIESTSILHGKMVRLINIKED